MQVRTMATTLPLLAEVKEHTKVPFPQHWPAMLTNPKPLGRPVSRSVITRTLQPDSLAVLVLVAVSIGEQQEASMHQTQVRGSVGDSREVGAHT